MSFGRNTQKQSSVGASSSQSQNYGSDVWGAQAPYLQGQYADANAIYGQSAGTGAGMGQAGYDLNGQALGQAGAAAGAMGGMLQGARGYVDQGMQALSSPYISQAQRTLQGLQAPGVDPMMDVYARNIGQQFREQILPGLQGDAIAGGGLGGSRAGIASGLAGARAGQQIQDFAAQLYGSGQDRALAAAQGAGNLQGNIAQGLNQGAGMYGQIGQGYGQQGQMLQGIGEGQLNNAQFGMAVPWYGATQRAGLLGGPVMRDLGGQSSGVSMNWGQGSGSGQNARLW